MIKSAVWFLAASAFAQPAPPKPNIPDNVIHEPAIVYSTVGQRTEMDILRPRTAGPHPTILAIHGGGFRAGRRESYIPMCVKAAQQGYVCATASYRLAPRHQFPAPVEDVKNAVRFLRANAAKYTIDPSFIGAVGGSAGGHLVLFLGLTAGVADLEGSGHNLEQSSRVQAVVNYYGPTDFTKSYGKSVDAHEVLPMFLGGDLEHNRRAHIKASPLYHVNPNAAPILTIHGTEDKYVGYEQALWMQDRLQENAVPHELLTLQGAGHGFKGADADKAEAAMFAWFDRYLRPKKERLLLLSDHGPKGEILAMNWPSGKVLWTAPNKRGHDVQPLPNGHVLYTINPDGKAVELDENHKQVWECCEGLQHVISAERLANGNTLIGDPRLGKVIEVDKAKNIVWKYESADLANMRSRHSTRTPSGTTLIAIEADAKIIEVDRAGKIVWTWQAEGGKRLTYRAQRLANGNTLVSMADPGELVEVNPAGKIVRSIGGADPGLKFGWVSGVAVLKDGNMIVNDYTGRRMVEVDPQGKVVHQMRTGARTMASIAVVE